MVPTLVDSFRRWFEYEKDSHRAVLKSLDTVPESGRQSEAYHKALGLVAHIVAARRVWLHRIDPAFERPRAPWKAPVPALRTGSRLGAANGS